MTQRVHNERKTLKLIIFITQKLSTKKLFLEFRLDYCDISLWQRQVAVALALFRWKHSNGNVQCEFHDENNILFIKPRALPILDTFQAQFFPVPMEWNFGRPSNCQHVHEWILLDWNYCYYLWCCSIITFTWVHCMLQCYYHFENY